MARRGPVHYSAEWRENNALLRIASCTDNICKIEKIISSLDGMELRVAECRLNDLRVLLHHAKNDALKARNEIEFEKANKSLDEKLGIKRDGQIEQVKQSWWRRLF